MTPLVPEIYPFDRAKHVYHSEALTEIIKDTIRFFNGTPVQPLPPTENFDGFGNHTPGAGRFQQAKSDWYVLHPGREWAERCTGVANALSAVKANVKRHLEGCDDLH